jgi:hypothetical protein
MGGLKTSYEFTLPRGYVDDSGRTHRVGTMRLATARDELEPLRDPSVAGPDDPRLTILVLARVIESLGDLPMITTHTVEGLFAVDLAYLQDFYGVINFGTQEEFDELVRSQRESALIGSASRPAATPAPEPAQERGSDGDEGADEDAVPDDFDGTGTKRPSLRHAVEELPRQAL